jgi:hypothetical protein
MLSSAHAASRLCPNPIGKAAAYAHHPMIRQLFRIAENHVFPIAEKPPLRPIDLPTWVSTLNGSRVLSFLEKEAKTVVLLHGSLLINQTPEKPALRTSKSIYSAEVYGPPYSSSRKCLGKVDPGGWWPTPKEKRL